jgi:hypothetical protein
MLESLSGKARKSMLGEGDPRQACSTINSFHESGGAENKKRRSVFTTPWGSDRAIFE